ncbi:MAG: TRAM domain-containing protein, partial [Betaproteobacteria bacterium]
ANTENTLARIKLWRSICPDLTIRSTFIAGFPGETEAEFQELLDFLEEAQLDRVGCFAYSPVEGATANRLPDAVPDALREERRERLMKTQEKISRAKLKSKVGQELTVLVDVNDGTQALARSSADAPEIDGQVIIANPGTVAPGEFVKVKITRANAHDLFARRLKL